MSKSCLNIYSNYITKNSLFEPFIKSSPHPKLGISIIIPCYNEPDIIKTLNSITRCKKPKKNTEVIVVINSSEISKSEIIDFNKETQKRINNWASKLNLDWLQVYTILLEDIPKKKAGVGFARKTGMDEAVNRFLHNKIENGVLCSLDADAVVSNNYLIEIEKTFFERKTNGCSIYFEHEIEGSNYSNEIYRRIIEYELHLRYFKLALQKVDFPHYHYTIGSCFAVSPIAYCLQGGMNSKQAGEDFYFLQKIMPMGKYQELNSTIVYPSSRPSDRVPFGTGPTIQQHALNPAKEFTTYNIASFAPLKELFSKRELLFKIDEVNLTKLINDLPNCLKEFLFEHKFKEGIKNINTNTKRQENFNRKFHGWFDGFRIIKYLNYVHLHHFNKQNIFDACLELLELPDYQISPKELLITLRKMEKNIEI